MRYLIALLCPPLGILFCGRPFLALFSILLIPFYFPAALLALLIVSAYHADRRMNRFVEAAEKIERSHLRAVKSHVNEVNRAIRLETRIARQASQQREAEAGALEPPRRPMVTWEGVRSAGSRARELAIVAKGSGIQAYRDLPEWAQPVTWGLAAGTPVSMALIFFMVARG